MLCQLRLDLVVPSIISRQDVSGFESVHTVELKNALCVQKHAW